jgi:hypothetical protein
MPRDDLIAVEAESNVRLAADDLMMINLGECLLCYVDRMIDQVGCDTTLRFAKRFRDHRAPRVGSGPLPARSRKTAA